MEGPSGDRNTECETKKRQAFRIQVNLKGIGLALLLEKQAKLSGLLIKQRPAVHHVYSVSPSGISAQLIFHTTAC